MLHGKSALEADGGTGIPRNRFASRISKQFLEIVGNAWISEKKMCLENNYERTAAP
jgi:hypothetical protein